MERYTPTKRNYTSKGKGSHGRSNSRPPRKYSDRKNWTK